MASSAIVITVRNERDLLRSNILYHRYLGVSRFYIYLDGTTDGTEKTVDDLSCVVISDSVSAEDFLQSHPRREMVLRTARVQRAIEKSRRHHTARQVLNTLVALEDAREKGIEWLIPIDADELICASLDRAEAGQLIELFDEVEDKVEQVRFRPLEIVQQSRNYLNVFAEGTLFKRPHARVARPVYDPFRKKVQRFELKPTRFWKIRLSKIRRLSWWYGHHEGKCAIRPNLDTVPLVHRFEGLDGRDPITREYGYLLHYLMYNADDFIKKYRNFENRPDRFDHGMSIPYTKKLWRNMVNDHSFSEDFIRSYYDRWIAFSEEEIDRLREPEHPNIISVRAVCDIFEHLLHKA